MIICRCRTIDELMKEKQLKGVAEISIQNSMIELLNCIKIGFFKKVDQMLDLVQHIANCMANCSLYNS